VQGSRSVRRPPRGTGIGSGTSGATTGKVTSQHDLFYARAVADHGESTARTYGQANQAAIDILTELTDRHGIDAMAARLSSYVFTRDPNVLDDLRAEATAAADLGLPARFVTDLDLPFPVHGAVEFADQLQVHPGRLVHGLARAVNGDGSVVHEHSRVTDVETDGEVVHVRTDRATVTADHAVVATLLPILDRGFEFAKTNATRSYGVAMPIDPAIDAPMSISAESPKRSLRRYRGSQGTFLVVVGDSHPTGHGDDLAGHWRALVDFAREHFPVASPPAHRWSSQDFVPVDGIPYVGRLGFTTRVQIATGFKKWGLSNGVVAARIMTDAIVGRDNPWASTFSAGRLQGVGEYAELVKDNLHVAKRFASDRIGLPGPEAAEDLEPGQGIVVRDQGRPVAVCRTPDGDLQAVDGVCSHLGCVVSWNDAEVSWDCPCHGSRFAANGTVLTGPTRRALDAVDLDR
jgi:glycine/D-amino acid oxidase-like deaminating enzyme/nitrite reductase/ring-hydroxylating ferredoxin subunit